MNIQFSFIHHNNIIIWNQSYLVHEYDSYDATLIFPAWWSRNEDFISSKFLNLFPQPGFVPGFQSYKLDSVGGQVLWLSWDVMMSDNNISL